MRKSVRRPHSVVSAIEDAPIFTNTLEVIRLRVCGLRGAEKTLARLKRYGLQATIDPTDSKFVLATPNEPATMLVQVKIGRGSGGPLRLCQKYFDDYAVAQTGDFWFIDNPAAPVSIEAVTGDFAAVSIICSPTVIVPRFVVLTARDQNLERDPADVQVPDSALR